MQKILASLFLLLTSFHVFADRYIEDGGSSKFGEILTSIVFIIIAIVVVINTKGK